MASTDNSKTLGPADEQAFLSKLSSIFYDQMEKLRKAPKPLSQEVAVQTLCDAFEATLPGNKPKLGGLGTDNSKVVDEEDQADGGADEAAEDDANA